MKRKLIYGLLGMMCLTWHCKDPYRPDVTSTDVHYLVVDGAITGGQDDTTAIMISHTRPLTDNNASGPLVDAGARVEVEAKDGPTYPLVFNPASSKYEATGLPLQAGAEYRLHVWSEQKEYLSDYTPYKLTPPIDSVYGVEEKGGMQIYVNTHDATNTSQYYRWRYAETWEYHSNYQSQLKFDTLSPDFDPLHPDLVPRPYPEIQALYRCWHTLPSYNILIGTTSQLSADVLYKGPLVFFSSGDERLQVLYSIMVKQTVLTREAYNYWVNVKKITEQIGDIFGPLPSEIHGNIHNVNDPAETVVGFITAASSMSQRIFIKPPADWIRSHYNCPADTVVICDPMEPDCDPWQRRKGLFAGGGYFPLNWVDPQLPHNKILAASGSCVDCQYRGGVNVKPDFWPN
ncbi:hypothetical protein DCC81_21815 [Chitinophaga parva]|uniref:DUF4249 domain-containing protein n=1 Tax=Chitinophaga parva TaxID=2169414 RepID=A0A2T7BD75_9BACT|nr:DUF4249 domain-containing protein [Chitinophaga parva]PUZ23044.1 hypothetical protein DCC81_21815 [Chitinophaga parva]